MIYSNPTQVKIGMEGTFAGKRYRVVGRVVLGVMEAGAVYYWQEYNLETDAGEVATLVFEANDYSAGWKFFTMFEPQFAISAEDAATKRLGQLVNLDGVDCRVTRVDRSKIYYLEGKAPEGEVVGAHANYFNARAGSKMIVVSWTGDEVECYRGMDITSWMVASAFNLKKMDLAMFHLVHGRNLMQANWLVGVLAVFAGLLILMALASDARPVRRPPAVRQFDAPGMILENTDFGTLNGKRMEIVRHSVVEVDEVGMRSERHEYLLKDEEGNGVLLIQGMRPGTNDWALFTPLSPAEPLTAEAAAKVVAGRVVNVDGVTAMVTGLFRTKVEHGEWLSPLQSNMGEVSYGFFGRQNSTLLLVRWNVNEIMFYKGTAITEAEVKAAFAKGAAK